MSQPQQVVLLSYVDYLTVERRLAPSTLARRVAHLKRLALFLDSVDGYNERTFRAAVDIFRIYNPRPMATLREFVRYAVLDRQIDANPTTDADRMMAFELLVIPSAPQPEGSV